MLVDPPPLVGKRVRFLAVVKNQRGEVERVRARVWTDRNIEKYYDIHKERSRAMASAVITALVSAVGAGDIEAIPKIMGTRED